MAIYQKNVSDGFTSFSHIKSFLLMGVILLGISSCGSERRDDLQDAGKVSVSDSTTNANPGGPGVGNAGKGYVEEGPQSVGGGEEGSSENTNDNNFKPEENILKDDTTKRKQ
jgi:hypothetical protein